MEGMDSDGRIFHTTKPANVKVRGRWTGAVIRSHA
jgi:hypothetical protein